MKVNAIWGKKLVQPIKQLLYAMLYRPPPGGNSVGRGGRGRDSLSRLVGDKNCSPRFFFRSKLFLPSLPPGEHCASLMCLLFRRKTEGVTMLETFADFFFSLFTLLLFCPVAFCVQPSFCTSPTFLVKLQDF